MLVNAVICNVKTMEDDVPLKVRVARRLKEIRESRGYTQEDVRYHMKELNIGRIESGRHLTLLGTIEQLCDFYGLSLAEFFSKF